ncbi:MAG: hypothetical protein K2G11_05290 [Muribaculaceae bacterium]|nr:hypothetical protein [Muribaculaceae bacterium]
MSEKNENLSTENENLSEENENLRIRVAEMEEMCEESKSSQARISKVTDIVCDENKSLRHQVAHMESLIIENQRLKEKLDDLEQRWQEKVEEIKHQHALRWFYKPSAVLGKRLESLTKLVIKFYDENDNEISKNKVYKEALKEVEKLKSSEFLNNLKNEINTNNNDILISFRKQQPSVSDDDLNWIALMMAGLTPRSIAFILDMNISTLYSKRNRLREVINNSDWSDKEQFLSMLNGK